MSFQFTFVDEKQFASASMDKRKAFLMDITQATGRVSELSKDEIIELISIDNKFLNSSGLFNDIILYCNKSFLDSESFVHILFYICNPKARDFSRLRNDQFFRERYQQSEVLKSCVDKFVTYNLLDSELFEIDSSTLKDGCGGNLRWPYMFLVQMRNSLSRTIIDSNVAMVFGERLTESLMMEHKETWDTKLCNVLSIHTQSLKRMCSSYIFKQYLEKSNMAIHSEYIDCGKKLPEHLYDADTKLKNIINYSKLIKPKRMASGIL